jgi:hypothetical protein
MGRARARRATRGERSALSVSSLYIPNTNPLGFGLIARQKPTSIEGEGGGTGRRRHVEVGHV